MTSTKPRRSAWAMELEIENWNRSFPIGTPVAYWSDSEYPDDRKITRTRSKAGAISSGQGVVLLEGEAGGWALNHVEAMIDRLRPIGDDFDDLDDLEEIVIED